MSKKLAISFVVVWLLVTIPAVVMLVSKKNQPVVKPQEPRGVYGMPPEYELAKRKNDLNKKLSNHLTLQRTC